MLSEETVMLPPSSAHENILVLQYSPMFIDELESLRQSKQLYDVIVVNVTQSGFLFPSSIFVDTIAILKKLLSLHGGMVFAHKTKMVAFVRESLAGSFSVNVCDTLAALYDCSPTLAAQVQTAIFRDETVSENTDLTDQVLLSAIPILTSFGIKLKSGIESAKRRNIVLGVIDCYTPVSAIAERVASRSNFSSEELLEELRSLEQVKAIFPIFPKVPFLVNCFCNQIPFDLRDYLIAGKFITQDQIDEMNFEQQNIPGKQRLSLGPLSVSKGYLSTRQLEIAMQDLAFYGQARDMETSKKVSTTGDQSSARSLVGHLGTTDPAGLLQSLATNRETGVLSVELADLQFRALFDMGRITHAALGGIKGNLAIIEFVSGWTEGVFVFIHRQPPADLVQDACKLSKPLDKLLLDSALAQDTVEAIWKKLPKGNKTTLEKLPDINNLYDAGQFVDLSEEKRLLTEQEVATMKRLWQAMDGLMPLVTTIRGLSEITTLEAALAVERLLHYQLVNVPAMDIAMPLEKFQQIVNGVSKKIGIERNLALLRLALQATQGYSVRARMLLIGSSGEIGVDMSAARSANTSLSMILKDLDDWQVKYVEYISQELDRDVLKEIVYKAHT